jgi:hypothetical protein
MFWLCCICRCQAEAQKDGEQSFHNWVAR